MNTFQLLKDFVTIRNYHIKEEGESFITFHNQMNYAQFWISDKGYNFFSLIFPGFAEMTDENYPDVIMRCDKLNRDLKQVKLYTISNTIIVRKV